MPAAPDRVFGDLRLNIAALHATIHRTAANPPSRQPIWAAAAPTAQNGDSATISAATGAKR
jgi:hypothetical protein